MQYNQYPTITTPKEWHANISAANTNMDGTGTIVALVTGGASGSEIYAIDCNARVTTAAGIISFFDYDGSAYRRVLQIRPVGVTLSAANGAEFISAFNNASSLIRPDGSPLLIVASGHTLYVSTYNSETWDITAVGGDL